MNAHEEGPAEEAPFGPDEEALAEFLDEALEGLVQGRPVSEQRWHDRPQLRKRGLEMLRGMERVWAAARAVNAQSSLLASDVCDLPDEFRSGEETTTLPDPFPGEYRFEYRLGGGSFGTVWRAADLHLQRVVAIKTILPGSKGERGLQLLREEARVLASLQDPHVVQVHAWREAPQPIPEGGRHFLIQQYVAGGSLAEHVRTEGPLSWTLATRYAAEVGEGLRAVHARNIVHRDVKPANILWDPERDEAVLTDFGISTRLTEPGTVAGTPFYMPPEAFDGTINPAQDVYGLAASLFWLVTGSVPFPALQVPRLLEQIRRGLPGPDRRCAGLPRAVERLIRDGLTADPTHRPTLDVFVAQLRGTLNQLLLDSILLTPAPERQAPVRLRLTVSRQTARHVFLPVATSQPAAEQLVRDVKRVPRDPEQVDVQTGERMRVEVEADQAGYLSVFNVGPTGNLNLLFPLGPEPATIAPGQPLRILDLELSPPTGRERLFALWSRSPLPLRVEELLSLAEGKEEARMVNATRDIKRVQASVQQLRPEEWHATILELNHLPKENAR